MYNLNNLKFYALIKYRSIWLEPIIDYQYIDQPSDVSIFVNFSTKLKIEICIDQS